MIVFPSVALLVNALVVSTTLAAPASRSDRTAKRVERRARLGRPLQGADDVMERRGNATTAALASGLAGVVLDSTSTGTYKSITGTFQVPTVKGVAGSTEALSLWFGIDGDTCASAILQAGIDITLTGTSVAFDAWYEWYPNYAYDFSGITFSAGDTVKITVTATSTTAGTVAIQNVTKGTTVTKTVIAPSSSAALCEKSAEWILELYPTSSVSPLPNFGSITISSASVTTSTGTVGPSSGRIVEITGVDVTTTATSIKFTYV